MSLSFLLSFLPPLPFLLQLLSSPPPTCSAACAHVACESPGQSAVFIPTLLCERARVRGVRECGRPIGRISARPMTSPESASSYERALLGNPEIARRQGRSSSRSRLRNAMPSRDFASLTSRSGVALGALRCALLCLAAAAGKWKEMEKRTRARTGKAAARTRARAGKRMEN